MVPHRLSLKPLWWTIALGVAAVPTAMRVANADGLSVDVYVLLVVVSVVAFWFALRQPRGTAGAAVPALLLGLAIPTTPLLALAGLPPSAGRYRSADARPGRETLEIIEGRAVLSFPGNPDAATGTYVVVQDWDGCLEATWQRRPYQHEFDVVTMDGPEFWPPTLRVSRDLIHGGLRVLDVWAKRESHYVPVRP